MSKAKIRFEVQNSKNEDYIEETIWAESLGENQYKLLNSPFFAFGYSYLDIVIAERKDGILPVVTKIFKKSGHSTYRMNIFYELDSTKFLDFWNKLEKIGCTYENGDGELISVDVPDEANIYDVYALLEEGELNKIWDFEEADCSHPL